MTTYASSKTTSNAPSTSPQDWRHTPVFVQAGNETEVLGLKEGDAIPLGLPFEIDSPLFKGKALLRFRNAKSDDDASHDQYFAGRKRLMQTVLQGKFKKSVNMSDIYVGSVFDKPLAKAPPPSFTRIMSAIVRRVAPGIVLDLGFNEPKVIALYGGTAQTLSIDTPGNQPDMTSTDIPENVSSFFGDKLRSIRHRKKHLSSPKKAARYEFDTEHIYTFHTFDDAMDYGKGTMRIPVYGDYDIKPALGQPMTLTAVTTGGDVMFSFKIWHPESVQLHNKL